MQTLLLPDALRPHFYQELQAARAAYARQDAAGAFHHLERAHILGQRWAVSHTHVHLLMLLHGLQTRNLREILGQVPRIVFGFLGSLVGRVPTGNTGGANVKAEQPMPIPVDLQALLAPHK
ncbi:DUF3703 domain-containing protein [Hymenobacter psychrotolerans]|uniref:DUF3703 domain-containing protein n=1 Tax=Hymenobacter psychrotolerans DSM 18569 TaxID=1121959 RepID=A0A1M7H6B3_9BACT|nr:DUF3703 domain-containing protein [Hymenobacter psychrotolerans]SHM24162.1 Protein of unknown function [Hymenobacter psychrotolerans DSM 18569]